jgi:hypothetical protein
MKLNNLFAARPMAVWVVGSCVIMLAVLAIALSILIWLTASKRKPERIANELAASG